MVMTTAIILHIDKNRVLESRRVFGIENAKRALIECARQNLSNFEEYTQEDIDACVEEREFRTLTGSVQMITFEDDLSVLLSEAKAKLYSVT